MDQVFNITGMHCGNCIAKVAAALQPFADDVPVTLDPPQAILKNSRMPAVAALQAALDKIGDYQITPSTSVSSAPIAKDTNGSEEPASFVETYQPLLIIAAYIAVAAFAGTGVGTSAIDWRAWMMNFMAGFFLVFSAFKFLNLSGFADAYTSYDLLAKRWHGYGFIYPFLELVLGLAFLFRIAPLATNIATAILMGFSSLGVIAALANKRRIACACLGTVLKLPMSTITLVEDLGMTAMAGVMLLTASHN